MSKSKAEKEKDQSNPKSAVNKKRPVQIPGPDPLRGNEPPPLILESSSLGDIRIFIVAVPRVFLSPPLALALLVQSCT